MFRATSLSRLSAASDFSPDQFSVGFSIKRQETGGTEPLPPGVVPVVHPGDQVHLEMRDGTSRPIDINVLYIGSDYSIGHMYGERLHSGNEITVPLLEFTSSSFGIERMVVVLSEAAPQTPVEDLSFLEQVGVRQQSRAAGAGTAGFGDLLRDVAGAPGNAWSCENCRQFAIERLGHDLPDGNATPWVIFAQPCSVGGVEEQLALSKSSTWQIGRTCQAGDRSTANPIDRSGRKVAELRSDHLNLQIKTSQDAFRNRVSPSIGELEKACFRFQQRKCPGKDPQHFGSRHCQQRQSADGRSMELWLGEISH
ncbi:hypothetical protein [Aliihoeflea sp. PC F10.4]